MGQVLAGLLYKLYGKALQERQIRMICDRVFDRIMEEDSGEGGGITFENLYIAVLIIYNDMNKHLPGPHNDPPSKQKLRSMVQKYDLNLDGLLDRDEFADFIQRLAADTVTTIGRNLIIAVVVAPALALATKRSTERIPGVGKAVKRMPNSVYASVVTFAVLQLFTF